MLLFYEKVFDEYAKGNANLYTLPSFYDLLGSAARVTITGTVKGVLGTSPGLTVQFEQSFDMARWVNQQTAPEANAVALVLGYVIQPFANNTYNTVSPLPFVRLRVAMNGTGVAGHIELFASGRTL